MATFALVPTSPSLSLLRPQALRFLSSIPQPRHTKSLTLNPNPTSATRFLRSTPPANDSDALESEARIVDEWGEKAEPEPESELTRFTDPDPAKDVDEWGGDEFGNGKVVHEAVETVTEVMVEEAKDELIRDLKRALVDTVYGTNLGFGASVEVRAEVLELVIQLEAANPTPAPVEAPELLGGNWV